MSFSPTTQISVPTADSPPEVAHIWRHSTVQSQIKAHTKPILLQSLPTFDDTFRSRMLLGNVVENRVWRRPRHHLMVTWVRNLEDPHLTASCIKTKSQPTCKLFARLCASNFLVQVMQSGKLFFFSFLPIKKFKINRDAPFGSLKLLA